MKNIVARKTIVAFYTKHADSETPLLTWYKIAMKSNWKSPGDVKKDFSSADIVGNDRIVFNIKGNNYRLIVKFNFNMEWGWIRFIGTHAEYDKIEASTI
jgi:mRNA interferase HigB